MRTLVIVLALVAPLAIAKPARADVGIGLFLGRPTGVDAKIGIGNRSGLDLLFGFDNVFRDGRVVYGHVTYLATLFVGRGSSVLVPLRLGIGGALYGNHPNFGVRAPLELGFKFRGAPVEIYLEIAALLQIVDTPVDLSLQGGAGFRIYF
jgi:hypothetical protein